MAKPGRNDPCPCGSGKKYKRCCRDKDEAAERAALVAALPSSPPPRKISDVAAQIADRLAAAQAADADADKLFNLSNAAVDLVHEGKLDQAEQAARDLIARFPDVHDGWDRLGMVHEARGEPRQAADCYRKVIALIRTHPDDYDPGFESIFLRLVARLDPPPAT